MIASLLAVASALMIGAADFVGGRAAKETKPTALVATAQLVELVCLAILMFATGSNARTSDLILGGAAGVAGSLAFAIFLAALARGPMSLVSPFTALIGVVTPVAAGVVLGERPSGIAWAGAFVGIAAIALTSTPVKSETVASFGRGATLAMAGLAGIGFGAFVIVLDATRPDAGLAPLVAARVCGVTALLLVAGIRRERPPRGRMAGAAAMIGVLEGLGVAALITALHDGTLVLVGVLSSLYPVVTVVLAVALLGERLDRIHRVGVILAMGAVVLISTG